MYYSELEDIINYIKKTVKCPSCNHDYTDDTIQIIGTTPSESLFYVNCESCQANIAINVTVKGHNQSIKTAEIKKDNRKHKAIRSVSKNDILDTKNFLKHFNGDFKNLFTKK